jgi:molybdenum cofactor cytidylyltransferase
MIDRSRIWGVVLAAGLSRRFGSRNKLTAPIDGVPLVRRTVEAYVAARLAGVLVVTGHEHEEVEAALATLGIHTVFNPDFAAGQSTSLRAGVLALPEAADATVIGVADQPSLTADVIAQLVDWAVRTASPIVAPLYAGERGNPVLFARELFCELASITGDTGGRTVIARHRDRVHWVDIASAAAGADIDRPDDIRGGSAD